MCMFLQPYPDGWSLPGGGAQRGNVLNLNGAGDPLTPGYPAKGVKMCIISFRILSFTFYKSDSAFLTDYTYRSRLEDGVGLPKIPVHPIGYYDAIHLLK